MYKARQRSWFDAYHKPKDFYVSAIIACLGIGVSVGLFSALFLWSLEWVGATRNAHAWLIYFLPIFGLGIGYWYYHAEPGVKEGNNVLIRAFKNRGVEVPWVMAPMIFFTTLLTHLGGGSAGREGTAVQIGGAVAFRFRSLFSKFKNSERLLIIMGISSGFSAVFGTPWAGTIFALEVLVIGTFQWKYLMPSLASAWLAHTVCISTGVPHTHYVVPIVPGVDLENFLSTILSGVAFGLAAVLFIQLMHVINTFFAKWIPHAPLRPFVGGCILLIVYHLADIRAYIGLGIPYIEASFKAPAAPLDFLYKIICTATTLGTGFKGGEVTPLFFIGSTLGSTLSTILTLPTALMAAMGFVAVFGASSKTPLACIIMATELFGIETLPFAALACTVAYFTSGSHTIYSAQHD